MFFIDRLGSYGLSVGSIGLVHFVSLMGGGDCRWVMVNCLDPSLDMTNLSNNQLFVGDHQGV